MVADFLKSCFLNYFVEIFMSGPESSDTYFKRLLPPSVYLSLGLVNMSVIKVNGMERHHGK